MTDAHTTLSKNLEKAVGQFNKANDELTRLNVAMMDHLALVFDSIAGARTTPKIYHGTSGRRFKRAINRLSASIRKANRKS